MLMDILFVGSLLLLLVSPCCFSVLSAFHLIEDRPWSVTWWLLLHFFFRIFWWFLFLFFL